MVEISEPVFGFDQRNCSFFVNIKESDRKTLLDQIYDRYNDLSELNGIYTYSLSYKSNQFIREDIEKRIRCKSDSVVVYESDVHIETKSSPRKPCKK